MTQTARPTLIGARLRELRLAAGLRQGELALQAGISASYLNLIEHDRRNVTPEVLHRLSVALEQDLGSLLERSPQLLIEALRTAAARVPVAAAEVERTEDFARRFPGWAALLAAVQGQNLALEQSVAALNDRIGHDPHLSAALHELLTALSAVRATSAILVDTVDLDPEWQRRFQRNLHQDSERLVQGAEALVAWLDRSAEAPEAGMASAQDQLERWLAARGWHLPELESGDLGPLRAEIAGLPSAEARHLAAAHLAQGLRDAKAMPLHPFTAALTALGPDPALLARRFDSDVVAAMRRLALLPGAEAGFVCCDASGTLLFRKPIAGFSLPGFGAACPLWPLFAALARPGQPSDSVVETPAPGGGRFRTLAFCQTSQPWGFAGPELRHAAMLILPDPSPSPAPAFPIGSTCRICPRADCPARREASILGHSL